MRLPVTMRFHGTPKTVRLIFDGATRGCLEGKNVFNNIILDIKVKARSFGPNAESMMLTATDIVCFYV